MSALSFKVLFLAMIVNSILDATIGYQLLGGDAIAVLFAFSFLILAITSVRPLTRKLLWRVRNRLLVTYLLLGVVPIVLIFVMLGIGFSVLFGQIAAKMVYDEIVRVKGVDVLFIGSGDLSQSMGYVGQQSHPEVLAVMEKGVKRIRDAGVVAGVSCPDLLETLFEFF